MALETDFAPKYWKFQQTLKTMILDRNLCRGDKIPSVRQLCRDSGLSLGTVQKASRKLVEEQVLIRKRGSGTYVRDLPACVRDNALSNRLPSKAESAAVNAGGPTLGFPVSAMRTIRFCAESTSPEHTPLWRGCLQDFERSQHHVKVTLADVPPANMTTETLNSIDVIETGILGSDTQLRLPPADLSGFGLPARRTDTPELNWFVPLHLSVPCLAYNVDLLDRLGVAPPRFLGFDEQMAFLENVTNRLRAQRGLSLACNVPPHMYLGGLADELSRRIRNSETLDLDPKERALIDKAIRLKEIFLHGRRPNDYDDGHVFSEGHAPVFPCWHYQAMAFTQNRLPFEFGFHPFFSVDDLIRSYTMGLSVNAETKYPVECIRFIRFLLSDKVERKLVEGGVVPARTRDLSGVLRHPSPYSQDALSTLTARVTPILPLGREEQYIVLSVIEPEMYAAASADDFLVNIQVMGNGFMRFGQKRDGRDASQPTRLSHTPERPMDTDRLRTKRADPVCVQA